MSLGVPEAHDTHRACVQRRPERASTFEAPAAGIAPIR